MPQEVAAKWYLNWAIERALQVWDTGDHEGAIDSLTGDTFKYPKTQYVAATARTVLSGKLNDREAFEKALRGYNASE